MRTKISGIYVITCTDTGKVYVGSSGDVVKRWERHRTDLRLGNHHSDHLQRSWNKRGEQAFGFAILELVEDPKMRIPREQFWLDRLQAYHPDHGYNCNPKAGSNLGRTFSEQAKANMAAAHLGKKQPQDVIERRRQTQMGAKSHWAKLTTTQVEAIRERLIQGSRLSILAREYGVTASTIHSIRTGSTWTEISPPGSIPPPNTKGSERWGTVLDEESVIAIKGFLKTGCTKTELAARFHVGRATINDIAKGRTWNHVKDTNE